MIHSRVENFVSLKEGIYILENSKISGQGDCVFPCLLFCYKRNSLFREVKSKYRFLLMMKNQRGCVRGWWERGDERIWKEQLILYNFIVTYFCPYMQIHYIVIQHDIWRGGGEIRKKVAWPFRFFTLSLRITQTFIYNNLRKSKTSFNFTSSKPYLRNMILWKKSLWIERNWFGTMTSLFFMRKLCFSNNRNLLLCNRQLKVGIKCL